MVLWVEKYRPQSLQSLTLHPQLSATLSQLIADEDFPHLLLYGPSGGGKKTRIQALLRGLFGKGVDKVKVSHKAFKVKSRAIEISTLGSNHHIEINPSDVGISDRHVVQEVIKEIAQTQNVAQGAHAFKVVVLNEVDRLSMQAQQALRRTMEKYTASCRLILVCESTSRVIAPLRSRCLAVRVPAPSKEEISGILNDIAAKEGLTVSPQLTLSIAEESQRNLRRAILMMEAAKVKLSVTAAEGKDELTWPLSRCI
jgi:replication factor C subunit 3/5